MDSQSILEAEWIIDNEPIRDAIGVDSKPVFYKIYAKAKQSLKISFKSLSGNVNFKIQVLGPDYRPLLDTEIATINNLNTKQLLPIDGIYLIAISKTELNPPAQPKATSYELIATVE